MLFTPSSQFQDLPLPVALVRISALALCESSPDPTHTWTHDPRGYPLCLHACCPPVASLCACLELSRPDSLEKQLRNIRRRSQTRRVSVVQTQQDAFHPL